MEDEIKEILDILNKNKNEIRTYCYYPDDVLSCYDLIKVLDYITNLQKYYNDIVNKYEELLVKYSDLQEENKRLNNIINGIEEFIEYLDRETNVYLVNTAYTVILSKLKELKEGK